MTHKGVPRSSEHLGPETQNAKLRAQNSEVRKVRFIVPGFLIESARFPPFGFDTAEISSNSNEDIVRLPERDTQFLIAKFLIARGV